MNRPSHHFDFKKSAFLECYHHLIEPPPDQKADINFLWGGRDSGKSRFIASKLIKDCLTLPYFRCVLIRKVYNTILGSQYQLIKDIVEEWKLDHLFKFVDKGCKITCLLNGNSFEGRGMDKPGKLKSFSNPSHAWAEEMNDLTLADFIIIITTLRYNEGRVEMWNSFNPEVDGDYEKHWLYKYFFSRKDPYKNFRATWRLDARTIAQAKKADADEQTFADLPNEDEGVDHTGDPVNWTSSATLLPTFTNPDSTPVESFTYQSTHTTYKDNKYVPPERIAILESMAILDPFYYLVFTLGKWGRRKTDDPFAYCYVVNTHSRPAKLQPHLEVILSFDFNVNPITCGVYQFEGTKVWGIETIQLENSNTYSMCDHIRAKYGGYLLRVTGDATGAHTSTMVRDSITNYTIIKTELGLSDRQLLVPKVNPSVKDNRVLFNACLHKLDVALDPIGCDPLHFDLQNVSCNDMGEIDKGSRTNPKKRADHLDHFRYFFNTFFYWVLKT